MPSYDDANRLSQVKVIVNTILATNKLNEACHTEAVAALIKKIMKQGARTCAKDKSLFELIDSFINSLE